MHTNTVQEFDRMRKETDAWIDDLKQRLNWHNRERVYQAFLGALHSFRDSLPRDEVVYLGNQLPTLLRGLYYDGWHPGAYPIRSRTAFLERIHESVHRDPGVDTEKVARSLFELLAARLPAAELEGARAATPDELHSFWPD